MLRLIGFLILLSTALHAAESKDRLVRETEPLTAERERAALHVPPGFEVQLFASEPMINKPINMAFDARGRLWVSSTVEYPYSADKARWSDPEGTRVKDSRDAIKILEDTDGDGKADKVTDFADGLNIPTGVLPWHKPEHKAGCIAWSIPNIWYFADTDGDDKADIRQILFGPLGYEKDTHGMCSSFRLGLDGWVYATHGFNNTSNFKAKDGSTLELHSGNVFRFRPDGSHVEIWSWGQVNPFGLCWDKYNNLYSSDCHSSPVYQLLKGAHYPSFGKPHNGLGFAPVMCEHSHGSTGICGIVYLDGGVWGPEWDDHMLVGNPVTSKVNHDLVTFTGSTPKANEKPDFITSDDPWFRPVDLQLGPDSALYIADFYNRIIGHYEVPLDHKGRDKERGRIWRVVKKGRTSTLAESSLATKDEHQLVAALDSPNLTKRFLAVPLLTEKLAQMKPVQSQPLLADECKTPFQQAYASWATFGLWRLKGQSLSFLGNNEDDFVDVHLLLRESEGPRPQWRLAIMYTASCLHPDSHPPVPRTQLAATRALTRCRMEDKADAAAILLGELFAVPATDPTLRQALLLAARDLLTSPEAYGEMTKLLDSSPPGPPPTAEDLEMEKLARSALQKISLTLPVPESAAWLLTNLHRVASASDEFRDFLVHIARNVEIKLLPELIAMAKQRTLGGVPGQVRALQSIQDGLSERGEPSPPELLAWSQELAAQMLSDLEKKPQPFWTSAASAKAPLWALKSRKCSDGTETQVLQSMTAGGGDEESRTGILRSREFTAPAKLSFWINGHGGFPKGKSNDKNLVRVVEATSGKVLGSQFAPRNDVCQRVEMELSKHAGKQVRLEIVDGDDGKAYAWLGITRIEPPVVKVSDFQTEDTLREDLKKLAVILQHSAPVALRERLVAYLPPRPAPPPLPISPDQRKQINALIEARTASFAKAKTDIAKGRQIFQANCAVCHRIGGEGGLIGPQLDGIGTRGAERLCEDILDPNRNVDAHFHVHTFKLKDGAVFSGFLKAEAGQVNILVDAVGKEHRVTKKDVEKSDVMPMSLMPPVFGQTIDEASFHHLLGYLLGK